MVATIIAGFTLGLVGSLHCVGMCGPLALALPVGNLSSPHRLVAILLYQSGRIATYALLGLLFGLLGRGFYLAGFQQLLSLGLGLLIVLFAILYFIGMSRSFHVKGLNKLYLHLQKTIGKLLKPGRGFAGFFAVGVANGLLPCGMVYVAVAAAVSVSNISSSVLFMAMFGAGTLPAMMTISYFGRVIPFSLRSSMRKAVPYFITAMGLLLILRGMNLGIPFISPALPAAPASVVSCHS
jgi:sulfite exporter TauE/SafE